VCASEDWNAEANFCEVRCVVFHMSSVSSLFKPSLEFYTPHLTVVLVIISRDLIYTTLFGPEKTFSQIQVCFRYLNLTSSVLLSVSVTQSDPTRSTPACTRVQSNVQRSKVVQSLAHVLAVLLRADSNSSPTQSLQRARPRVRSVS